MTVTVRAAINRFDKAAQDYAFVGSQPPEDRPLIEAEYRESKEHLGNTIGKSLVLTSKERTFILNLLYAAFQDGDNQTFAQKLYKKINK